MCFLTNLAPMTMTMTKIHKVDKYATFLLQVNWCALYTLVNICHLSSCMSQTGLIKLAL